LQAEVDRLNAQDADLGGIVIRYQSLARQRGEELSKLDDELGTALRRIKLLEARLGIEPGS
jgi:hypothetical protein